MYFSYWGSPVASEESQPPPSALKYQSVQHNVIPVNLVDTPLSRLVIKIVYFFNVSVVLTVQPPSTDTP